MLEITAAIYVAGWVLLAIAAPVGVHRHPERWDRKFILAGFFLGWLWPVAVLAEARDRFADRHAPRP